MTEDRSDHVPGLTLEHLALSRMAIMPTARHRIEPSGRLTPEMEGALRRSVILSTLGLSAPQAVVA